MMTVGGKRMVAPQQEASEEEGGMRQWRMAGMRVEALHLERVRTVEGLVVEEEEEGEEDGVDEVVGEEGVLDGNHRKKMEVRKRGQVVVLVDVVGGEGDLDEDEMKTTKMAVVVALVDVVVGEEVVLDEDEMEKTTKMAVVVLVDVVVGEEVVLDEDFQKRMEVKKKDQVVLVDGAVAGEGLEEAAEGMMVTMKMGRKVKVNTNSVMSYSQKVMSYSQQCDELLTECVELLTTV